jgi:Ser/Thr protein kinase RdoA (MazF antagonist)
MDKWEMKLLPQKYELVLNSLSAWELGAVVDIKPINHGMINDVYYVKSKKGEFALKCYTYKQIDEVRRSCTIVKFVAEHGIPTPLPIKTSDGNYNAETHNSARVLFPWINGNHSTYKTLTALSARHLGEFLAKVHIVLSEYPSKDLVNRPSIVDVGKAFSQIDHLKNIIQSSNVLDKYNKWALTNLDLRKRCLETGLHRFKTQISTQEKQLIHGDYLLTNLLFRSKRIAAIIDWDLIQYAPIELDILKTIHKALNLNQLLSVSFLKGYSSIRPLYPEQIKECSKYYALNEIADLWLYELSYIYSDAKVRRHIKMERLHSLSDKLSVIVGSANP